MASYLDTVLALNPVFFGVGTESAGPTMTNLAGGTNGTYDAAAVFGLASPIETDASIRSVGNVVGSVPAPDGSPTDLRGNQTWIAWAYYDGTIATTAHALGRTQQFGQSNGLINGFNGGVISSHINLDDGSALGAFYPLTDPIAPVSGNFYMISSVRNGTVFSHYTNERLAASRSDLTTDDVLLLGGSNLPWWIGRSGGSAAFPGVRTVMVALFDYALSQAQIVEVYESALNALFLSGRADANPTAILRSDFEPDPVLFPSLRHNWNEPLIERISFRTAISQSVNGIEEGVSQRIAPRRELEFSQLLRNNTERRKLRAQLWANQHAKWFVPVRQYAEQLLEPLSASATMTPIFTQYKDYETGLWIGFRQVDAQGNVEHSEVRQITSLNPNSVEHEALVNSYAAYRSTVYPVRRALIPRNLSITGHTDAVEELTITARLLPEDEALIPNRITQFTPTLKYRDVEVFDGQLWQSNDWSENREYEVERAGEDVDFEVGLMSAESDTTGASESFSYRMLLNGHENVARFLGWYYTRVGALNYVWVPTMQEDFAIVSVNADELTVSDTNYSDSYALAEPRRDLAFVYFDGSMEFRRVIGFSGTVNETLTLDAGVSTLTNLRLVSLLKYCRLDADQIELAWQTDDKVQVAWRFRELLHTPEGTGVSSLSPSASWSVSLSPSSSASPSASVSLSLSPSLSPSPSASVSPSASTSPSRSVSPSASSSASVSSSASPSLSPSASASPSV